MCAVDEQTTEITVSSLANSPKPRFAPGGVLFRHEPTKYASDVGDSVSRAARQMGESMASRVEELADSSADAASAVGGQVKTFASEIDAFGRKNPLGAIASALLVGVVIGMLGRRRN